ncbi:MAG: hypothetical protein AUH72_08115 [Acidobacteria bacterium 13_1_40CM_4_65_8]|nr:MAG: hypothetical protein AUH72_08115 [Acidobacteria bacterium 13_1_40CM_4_65_8]
MHQRCARVHGLERIGDWFEHLVIDLDFCRGLTRVELRVGHDHREKVGDTTRQLAFGDQHRLVRVVEAGRAGSGDVGGGEYPHNAGHRRRSFGVNFQNLRAGMLGQHHRAVQHPGHAHVVDERLLAERLLEPAQAWQGLANSIASGPATAGRHRIGGVRIGGVRL